MGVSLLRDGYADRLRLKRGDVWQESLGQWKKSGFSAAARMLVSSYGSSTVRPLLRTNIPGGPCGGVWTNGGGGSPPTIDNISFVGLHFYNNDYDGLQECKGADMLRPGSHVLFEDCVFQDYQVNLNFQATGGGRHSDFTLRRSIIVDAFVQHIGIGHSQGLYAFAVDGLLIEENVFDHNGWSETVANTYPDQFRHNLYIDNGNTGVVVRGNIIANGSSHGMQLRCGGVVEDNLFYRNSIGCLVGGGNAPEPGGVTANVRGNVTLEGKDIGPEVENWRGWGMVFGNIASGTVDYNIVGHNAGGQDVGLLLDDGSLGVHSLNIENNVLYDWGYAMFRGNASMLLGNGLYYNDFVNIDDIIVPLLWHWDAASVNAVCFGSGYNRFYRADYSGTRPWTRTGDDDNPSEVPLRDWQQLIGDTTSTAFVPSYPDPTRSVDSYYLNVLAGSPSSNFMTLARGQSAANWDDRYTAAAVNAYIQAGFGMTVP